MSQYIELIDFFKNLTDHCQELGITQKKLAELLLIDPASLNRSLHSKNGPKLNLIIGIANVLKVKPYELLLDEDDKKMMTFLKSIAKKQL